MSKLLCYTCFIGLLAYACSSSTTLLQRGDYDAAIERSIKRLLKNPTETNEISVLKRAYALANARDWDYIDELSASGREDVWTQLIPLYSKLRHRQDVLGRLPESVLHQVDYQRLDYNDAIAEAKRKAADYHFNRGREMLQGGSVQDARAAYQEFMTVQKYHPGYNNLEAFVKRALAQGTAYVIFRIKNNARVALPKDFEAEIRKISLSALDQRWLVFDTRTDDRVNYAFAIDLNLRHIEVSPEKVDNERYKEAVEVEDGYDYVLDARGNVMKDTAGNDIKIVRYKELAAYIQVHSMEKRSIVQGSLDYYNLSTGQLVKTVPLSSEFVFDYQFATFSGESKALSEESLRLVRRQAIPFPNDLQMIFDTNESIKNFAYQAIRRDRNLFLAY